MFILCLLPFRVVSRAKLERNGQYIFCPNHFSFIDIPTMGLNPVNAIFVGKNDMEDIPLFGFMYGKLHITVDRARLKSKYDTYVKGKAALDEGKSLVIYPEGGIMSNQIPEMARFKDGAFRLAIEKQIPIVPVTIPHNWIILPVEEFLLRLGRVTVIFHEPVETRGMTLEQMSELKQKVFNVIASELKVQNENRSRAFEKNRSPQPA